MPEYSEKQAYLELFRREAAIYEATPAWHFFSRAKLRKKVRYAYGDAVGSGSNVSMPSTALAELGRGFKRAWHKWLGIVTVFVVTAVVFVGCIALLTDDEPKRLPPGIQQRGYTFIIPPDYALRENYQAIRADTLCKRLPQFDTAAQSKDKAIASSGRDGSIRIHCKLDD